ncbi:heavy-metal-associated domain-containing protein [Flavobacterium lindanitolerans]|uniref:heavy-metal-associated domain-containing protein n=1 Tax=Flavobacterium lindanitolerans TaxID=428988 RepID=UPI0027BAB692|nr:heavy-metal-associated domain-containing protein [Flavobacterium lindanitolerans]
MKNTFLKQSILLFFMLFAVASFGQEGKKNQKAVIKTSIHCDHCKECETCGSKFQSNMLKIKGVRMYELDEKNSTLTVYYNATKTDLQTIKTAISKLGYDADDIKADTVAYESLDNCCKKA